MSLLWTLFLAVEPGTGGLDLPPKDDLAGRWIVGAVLILTPLIPYLVAKVQAKKPASNGPTPLTADSATPRIDAGQQYLERFVKSLEDRIKATEAKNEDLSQQVQKLLQERATFAAQVESLHADVVELRADNVELRAENRALRSRGNG
jgi:septal ring factor EnvC (AmiA/AmiB activator)